MSHVCPSISRKPARISQDGQDATGRTHLFGLSAYYEDPRILGNVIRGWSEGHRDVGAVNGSLLGKVIQLDLFLLLSERVERGEGTRTEVGARALLS